MIQHKIDVYRIYPLQIKLFNKLKDSIPNNIRILNDANPNVPLVIQKTGAIVIASIEEDEDYLSISMGEYIKGKLSIPLEHGFIAKKDLKQLFL